MGRAFWVMVVVVEVDIAVKLMKSLIAI